MGQQIHRPTENSTKVTLHLESCFGLSIFVKKSVHTFMNFCYIYKENK